MSRRRAGGYGAGSVHQLAGLSLSPAEIRELRYAATGLWVSEIAEATFRSPETIRSHRRQLLRKLGARNMVHAVHLAHLQGLLGDGEHPARERMPLGDELLGDLMERARTTGLNSPARRPDPGTCPAPGGRRARRTPIRKETAMDETKRTLADMFEEQLRGSEESLSGGGQVNLTILPWNGDVTVVVGAVFGQLVDGVNCLIGKAEDVAAQFADALAVVEAWESDEGDENQPFRRKLAELRDSSARARAGDGGRGARNPSAS